MGRAIGIHPALLAFVTGTEMFETWGSPFGAPVVGLVQPAAQALWRGLRAAPLVFDTPPAGERSPEAASPLAEQKAPA